MRRLSPLLLVVLVAVPLAHAEPVLHEFVPEASADEGELLVAADSDERAEPSALVYDGEVLPAPPDAAPAADEPALSANSQPGGGPSFRPDRLTELDSMLGYQSVFTPSITPFKRVTALDTVRLDRDGKTPVLAVGSTGLRALRVEGAGVPAADGRPRDRFWGEVVLDFREGRRVPLPSVSPESRILTVRTEPAVQLRFQKNGADAYFVEAVGPVPDEPVRLVMLTDAPRTYFRADLPDVAADTLAADVPPLPPSVRARGLAFAAELGLAPTDPLPDVLRTLGGYFRSFEESSAPPPDRGDIYLDLARSKKGVCRHRTYAFVVTAQALGIPARFVFNEAHAFAEVELAGVGWMRVDLGGAARGLDAHGARDKPQYRPDAPDPLPRPASYEQSYSQLGGNVSGVRPDALADQASWSDAPPPSPSDGARGPGDGAGPARPMPPGYAASSSSDSDEGPPGEAPADADGAPAPPDARELVPLQVDVERRRYDAYRGRKLEVAGRVTDDRGDGVAGLRVEVLLRRRGERLLGVTVSGDGGYYHASFGVPPQMPVGDYQLVVRTPGDDDHAPAVAY